MFFEIMNLDCKGLICNYGGDINPDTCTCTCKKSWMDPANSCESKRFIDNHYTQNI